MWFQTVIFKSLKLGSNTSSLTKIGTITVNTFLPTRNNFVYSYGIKICASVFNELLESIFYLLLVVEAFFLQEVEVLKEVVISWPEIRWKRWISKILYPNCSTFEALVVWRVVKYGEELDPFFWPVLAAGLTVFGSLHQFAERTSQM